MQKPIKDYSNQRFDRVIALCAKRIQGTTQKRTVWVCMCDCGKECEVPLSSLINQRKKNLRLSCGCFKKPGAREPAWRDYFSQYIRGAKDREYEFSLEYADFKRIASSICFYCGSEPIDYFGYYKRQKRWAKNHATKFDESYYRNSIIKVNGVDRKDNNKGYTIENSAPCCTACNMAKQKATDREFLDWAKRLATYQGWII